MMLKDDAEARRSMPGAQGLLWAGFRREGKQWFNSCSNRLDAHSPSSFLPSSSDVSPHSRPFLDAPLALLVPLLREQIL